MNVALNVGARFFARALVKSCSVTGGSVLRANVPALWHRSTLVLSDLLVALEVLAVHSGNTRGSNGSVTGQGRGASLRCVLEGCSYGSWDRLERVWKQDAACVVSRFRFGGSVSGWGCLGSSDGWRTALEARDFSRGRLHNVTAIWYDERDVCA